MAPTLRTEAGSGDLILCTPTTLYGSILEGDGPLPYTVRLHYGRTAGHTYKFRTLADIETWAKGMFP